MTPATLPDGAGTAEMAWIGGSETGGLPSTNGRVQTWKPGRGERLVVKEPHRLAARRAVPDLVGSVGKHQRRSGVVLGVVMDRRTAAGRRAGAPNDPQDARFREQVLPELDVLFRVARRLTGDANDAEDLVQDTLLRAYRAFDRFDGRYPRAWLLTIMRDRHINLLSQAPPRPPHDEVAQRVPAHGEDGRQDGTVERALHDDFDPIVRKALASLSTNHRSVIALVDLDGLTYQEAADLLDVPVGPVLSRLHRARRKVRTRLEAHGLTEVHR
jgi:RNA polymerase sigma-70 factor, ECF subfamily